MAHPYYGTPCKGLRLPLLRKHGRLRQKFHVRLVGAGTEKAARYQTRGKALKNDIVTVLFNVGGSADEFSRASANLRTPHTPTHIAAPRGRTPSSG